MKTGVSITNEAESGDNVGQGTVDGAIVSAANIDNDVNNSFSKSPKQISNATAFPVPRQCFKD